MCLRCSPYPRYNQEVCQGPYGNASYGKPYPESGGVESRPCASHPSCDDFNCTDFFTEWSECSRLCEGGVENRTFVVPPEAEEYNRRVCQAEYGQKIYPFPKDGGLDVRSCEDGNGYPLCGAYNCSDFFGNWSECDAFCGGGVETRTFVVPDDPLALRYDQEVCRRQCVPENGGTETRLCEDGGGYPNCYKFVSPFLLRARIPLFHFSVGCASVPQCPRVSILTLDAVTFIHQVQLQ